MKNSFFFNYAKELLVYKAFHNFLNTKFLIFFIVVLTAGCKKIIEDAGVVGLCPTVISTDPANGAINAGAINKITATFNEVIDSSTINASTFLLKQAGNNVAGTVTYSGTTATFTPAAPLLAHAIYTGTITTGVRDPANTALPENYVWSFNTGAVPTVVSTDPANGAINVATDKVLTATFSTKMDSSTINSTTFILKQGATIVQGVVSYTGMTATFTPANPLADNTLYSATITTGAKDSAGNSLSNDYTWNFVTGTRPQVISTDPSNGATNVALDKLIQAKFSRVMDSSTINSKTFVLYQGTTQIFGTVTYSDSTATFTPSSPLAANTVYTATILAGVKDTAGNSLASDYMWNFTTTGSTQGPPPSFLGSASLFAAIGGSAGITNQGTNTIINGRIGTTGASTTVTGFNDATTGDIYSENSQNVGNVTKGIFTAPPSPGTATSLAIATQALQDATSAYKSISPVSIPGGTDPGSGELGGLTLAPGVYKSASGTFTIKNGDLTLDAKGDTNAVWIFQATSKLIVGDAVPLGARSVILINGASAKNIYWYVGSTATINSAGGGVMAGTIISSAGITISAAGNIVQTVLNGRALSLNSTVTMVNTIINIP